MEIIRTQLNKKHIMALALIGLVTTGWMLPDQLLWVISLSSLSLLLYANNHYYQKRIKQLHLQLDELRTESQTITPNTAKTNDTVASLDQRQCMDLVMANESLQQFTSVASHDMKEPLRTIASFSKLLSRRLTDDPDSREFLDFIEDATKRMTTLIDDLIGFGRTGKNMPMAKEVSLNDQIIHVENNLLAAIRQNGAIIKYKHLPKLNAHGTLMTQLFQNIIANGIKFRKKEIRPVIEINWEYSNDETTLLSITDNGIGMQAEDAKRIFEPFRRLHSRIEYEGSGIGLATCKKIMKHYKGKIWAESTPGKGTTFYLAFPAAMQVKQTAALEQTA